MSNAQASNRLSLTVVWLSRFLAVVAAYDPAALRLPYYTSLLKRLVGVYRRAGGEGAPRSAPSCSGGGGPRFAFAPLSAPATPTPGPGPGCAAGAGALVRWCLGGLFAHANFPQRLFFEALGAAPAGPGPAPGAGALSRGGLDALELCDAAVLAELCPALRELQAELSAAGRARAPRHVTPLRVAPLPPERASARDRDLQVRRACRGQASRSPRHLRISKKHRNVILISHRFLLSANKTKITKTSRDRSKMYIGLKTR